MIDVMILNTTGISNDSVPSHEVQANVFSLIGSSFFPKLVFSLLSCFQSSGTPLEPTNLQVCASDGLTWNDRA